MSIKEEIIKEVRKLRVARERETKLSGRTREMYAAREVFLLRALASTMSAERVFRAKGKPFEQATAEDARRLVDAAGETPKEEGSC